ncbi:MAG: hypothetical protein DPW16_10625 [Chloroflexi bacterium]|nr:hypothetical protein [Chloroflexota bacterium]
MREIFRLILWIGGVALIIISGSLALARRAPPQSREIVYIAQNAMLHLMNIENKRQLRLTRDESVLPPVWSPDGKWVYFSNNWDIYRVRSDGADLKLLSRGGVPGLDKLFVKASPNGEWISYLGDVVDSSTWELFVMRPDGSELRQLTTSEAGYYIRDYWWSPDGNQLLFHTELIDSSTAFLEGRIINVDGTGLFRLPSGYRPVGWSSKNNEVLCVSYNENDQSFVAMRTDGSHIREIPVTTHYIYQPTVSPNGQSIIFAQPNLRAAGYSIYRLSTNGQHLETLADDFDNALAFVWSSDSQWIAFAGEKDGQSGLYIMKVDGSTYQYLAPLDFHTVYLGFAWRPVINLAWNLWWHLLGGVGIIVMGSYWRRAH